MRGADRRSGAFTFVLLIGVLSLFADFAYEGARSITGPYLGLLGATGAVVSIVAGTGEFLGYGLRLLSGPIAERTGRFWPMTILGYTIQMIAVPSLALAGNWPAAAALIALERVGKAVRNPPRDVMLSHAAGEIGYGWGFGLHEALDQFGALLGPLVVALVLGLHHTYAQAFAVLAVPAAVTLVLLVLARLTYPNPRAARTSSPAPPHTDKLPPLFWLYLSGAALAAAGFADFSLLSYHFHNGTLHLDNTWLPVFYAVAMAVSGLGSLLFGRLFDRYGLVVLVAIAPIAAATAPLVFFGGFGVALLGCALWGLSMGVHESIIPAAVALIVPQRRRGSAYGIFTGTYGISWLAGSVAIGFLYGRTGEHLGALVAFCIAVQLMTIPLFIVAGRRLRPAGGST